MAVRPVDPVVEARIVRKLTLVFTAIGDVLAHYTPPLGYKEDRRDYYVEMGVTHRLSDLCRDIVRSWGVLSPSLREVIKGILEVDDRGREVRVGFRMP